MSTISRRLLLLALSVAACIFCCAAEDENYFRTGMKWVREAFIVESDGSYYSYTVTTIPKDTVVDGYDAHIMVTEYHHKNLPIPPERVVVRCEGEKVYFKCIGLPWDDWYLLYDFGLRVGESCTVYSPVWPNKYDPPHDDMVTCVSRHRDDRFGGFPTMRMAPSKGIHDPYNYADWIVGIGCEIGVQNPGDMGKDGGGGGLIEASFNGEILFSRPAAGICGLESGSRLSARRISDLSVAISGP